MRRFITAACATALGIALSAAYAVAASASTTIVVRPGQSIQAAVNRASPGDTILIKPGVYHQTVMIRKDGITVRGSGNFTDGTVLEPPASIPKTLCNRFFGPTGICLLAKKVGRNGRVITPVSNVTVTALLVRSFPANGVFGYGTDGLQVTRVVAANNSGYGISRFHSTNTLFANDTAFGSDEAGFYVGDSPQADTVVRNSRAYGNQFGILIRHARHISVFANRIWGNCQGVWLIDDGEKGGVGNASIERNSVFRNNKLCPATEETPVPFKGGGILLTGATHTLVRGNSVAGNAGHRFNSGGIVVMSSKPIGGHYNPNFDTVARNTAYRDHPADLIWDGTGTGTTFTANRCATSVPSGLCH